MLFRSLGNVVIKVDFHPFIRWLAQESESGNLDEAEAVLRSSLFFELEFGRIDREGFLRGIGDVFKIKSSADEIEKRFCSIFPGSVDGMVELLGEISREQPVYALSNTNELHLSWIRRQHPETLDPFQKVFSSHELKKRKPDPGIYQDVCDALGVDPARIVFFDDLEVNIEGARQAGMNAYLFRDTGQVREILGIVK